MYINILGIVINETYFAEKYKYLTIVTNDNKKINVICKGKKNMQKTYIFLYGIFMLLNYKDKYMFIDIEIKKNLYILNHNLLSYALSCYIIEVSNKLNYNNFNDIIYLITKLENIEEITNIKIIKLVFELFILIKEGYLPNIENKCNICSKKLIHHFYFSITNGGMSCHDCLNNHEKFFYINFTIYKCLNFIINKSDIQKALLFTANEENIDVLSNLIEEYFNYYIDFKFNTINFYKKILIFQLKIS